MKPEFITFTGVDDDTDPAGLVQLADDYPVEFGLLFSPKRQGVEPRYPAMHTIEWLAEELPLRWAAHLCGADARSVIEEDRSQHDGLLTLFHRVQINTADPKVQPSLIAGWAGRRNLRAILQCRGSFPRVAAVDILFDASGGRGIAPQGWPIATRTTFCGYAGGLNPENVAQAVANIGAQDHLRYWIDMESGVRDERDRFSLEKCRAVCEAVYGPVAVGAVREYWNDTPEAKAARIAVGVEPAPDVTAHRGDCGVYGPSGSDCRCTCGVKGTPKMRRRLTSDGNGGMCIVTESDPDGVRGGA